MEIQATPFRFRATDNHLAVARFAAAVDLSIASSVGPSRRAVDAGVTFTSPVKATSWRVASSRLG